MKAWGSALAAVIMLAGCSSGVVEAYPAPPPLPAERMPLPPVSDSPLTWRPGDWNYVDGSYRYEAGKYVPSAGHGANWRFGHWTRENGQYVWMPGGWV